MKRLIFLLILLSLMTLTCNLPFPMSSSQATVDALAAELTAVSKMAEATTPAIGAETLETPTSTSTPTNPLPTPSPSPSPTSTASLTVTPLPCDRASFVSDVTIPDGAKLSAGEAFTKTWRLQNNGSCTWTSGYSLVFDHGDQMGGPASTQLTNGSVPPGGTVDASVNLTAPGNAGTYQGFWKLRNSDGIVFGVGAQGTAAFWVKINVEAVAPPPPAAQDWPIISQGDQGAEVYAIQYLLRSHNYNLVVDGIFGPQTKSQVIQFQGDKGLTVDGIVGPQTWSALISGKTVQNGSIGDAVRGVQQLLVDKFGYGIAVDGIFGPNTDQAVKDFQTDYGLQVDGIVGPKTWKALVSED